MDNEPRTIDSNAVEELRQIVQRLHALSGACMLNDDDDAGGTARFLGRLSAQLDDAAVAVQIYALDEHPLGGQRISQQDEPLTLLQYDHEAGRHLYGCHCPVGAVVSERG
jgi:hypothetical protein